MNTNASKPWRFTAPILLVALAGCATLPDDLGRSDVDALVIERGRTPGTGGTANLVSTLTSQPLTAEHAIRVALINNPELQARYAELGIAAAGVYAAGRIHNPVFSAAILESNSAGERNQVTFGLVTSFTDLLTLPARKRLATKEFATVKQHIGASVLEMAARAESAYYHFVAAKQVAALRAQIAKAGALSVALAERYHAAGNLTQREFAMEQAAAAEAELAALAAEAEAYAMRTVLASVMGLSVGDSWDAPAQLPVPLSEEDTLDDLLLLARASRLDLAAAHGRADIVADRLGVTGWTRWLGELDVGVERERETDGVRLTGPTVDWELPIFTQNRDALLRVDAELRLAIAEVVQLTLAVNNDVHLAHAATNNAKARVDTHRDRLVPARMAVTARAQEEENFMLIGIFEVLQTKQQEYDAYQRYLEVVRDYWLARTELTRVVGNTLPSSANIGTDRLDVKEFIEPQQGMDHSRHNMKNMKSTDAPSDEHAGHGNRNPDGEPQ